jgi:GNAT superfamily N-acetyltransferase
MDVATRHFAFAPLTIRLQDDSELLVRPVRSDDSMEELTFLLHRAYKRLADEGFRFVATYQSVDETISRIRNARCWVAMKDDTLVATLSLYEPCAGSCEWYTQQDVWHFGQFAVEPALQGQGIGLQLIDCAEKTARAQGARELALDTAEGASHLIRFYSQRGYRFVQHVQWDRTNYRSVVLSKNLVEE